MSPCRLDATTATFPVDTSTVPPRGDVTIQATYLGVTKTFVLTVRAPALVARFTVSSASRGSNACEIINAGGAVDCRLDATSSGGFISRYIWTLTVGIAARSSFSTGDRPSTRRPPTVRTSAGGTSDGNGAIVLSVRLMVEDRDGNEQHQRPRRA